MPYMPYMPYICARPSRSSRQALRVTFFMAPSGLAELRSHGRMGLMNPQWVDVHPLIYPLVICYSLLLKMAQLK